MFVCVFVSVRVLGMCRCAVIVIYRVMVNGGFVCFVFVCMLVFTAFCVLFVLYGVMFYGLCFVVCANGGLCVLLLFNVFVKWGCDVLCDVERFVVLCLLSACVFVCGSLA